MRKTTLLLLLASIVSSNVSLAQATLQDNDITVVDLPAKEDKASAVGLRLPTDKGSWMLGANLLMANMSFGGGASGRYGSYDVSVSPRIGYFVHDNLAVGMTLNYNTGGQTNRFNTTSVGTSFFGRYYFGRSTDDAGKFKKLRFFLEAGAGLNAGRSAFTHPDGSKDQGRFSTYSAYVMPGVSYFFNKHVSLEGSMYYQHTGSLSTSRLASPGSVNKIGFNLGLNIFLGKR